MNFLKYFKSILNLKIHQKPNASISSYPLEEEIRERLDNGHKITLKWDFGNDEAIVYSFLNNVRLDDIDKFSQYLEDHIIQLLDFPAVGLFSISGSGEVIERNGSIYFEYHSTFENFEEKISEETVFDEINTILLENHLSGNKLLF